MKKIFVLALVPAILCSCGTAKEGNATSDDTEKDDRGFPVLRMNNVVQGKETYFAQFPDFYTKNSKKKGKVERLDYETSVYNDGITYKKHLNVYLPYGYDENDTSRKYNVVYMQHGGGRSEDDLVNITSETSYQMQLDNLFDPDRCAIDPVIMVFPTYHLSEDKSVAGDAFQTEKEPNYYLEVTQDIIPLVESRYHTYYTGSSEEELIATRDHRAFGGYSRGGACTWYMSIKDFAYFRYWIPMSATSLGAVPDETHEEKDYSEIWKEHKTAIDANPGMPYFFYVSSGLSEGSGPEPHQLVNYLVNQTDYFVYGRTNNEKGLFYSVSEMKHLDELSAYYFYNSLQTVFH